VINILLSKINDKQFKKSKRGGEGKRDALKY
jgi:hypothetical protein